MSLSLNCDAKASGLRSGVLTILAAVFRCDVVRDDQCLHFVARQDARFVQHGEARQEAELLPEVCALLQVRPGSFGRSVAKSTHFLRIDAFWVVLEG